MVTGNMSADHIVKFAILDLIAVFDEIAIQQILAAKRISIATGFSIFMDEIPGAAYS